MELLERLEAVELNKSYVTKENKYFRIDDEFFNKKYLKTLNLIESIPNNSLASLSNLITDFGAFSQMNFVNYIDNGIPFLRNQDVKENSIDINNCVYVNDYVYNRLSLKLEENDILIPRAGTLGNAAVVQKNILPATANQNLAQIKPNLKLIKPYFLTTFLCSKFGHNQIERVSTGNVQQWLNLENINNIKIPKFSNDFQRNIEERIILSNNVKEKSKEKYTQAETLLLQEIGLSEPQGYESCALKKQVTGLNPIEVTSISAEKEGFSTPNTNVKSFKESFGTTGRLDAEYYQPKYENLIEIIKSYENGFSTLDSFIDNYSTGYPYKSETYCDEGIPLIRINNVSKGNLDLSNAANIPFEYIGLSEKDVALENDILISMSGTIGNSCRIPKGIKAVVNQRIMRFSPKNFDSEVLSLLINTIVGYSQLERIGTGGVQTNISATDIKNILIPKIKENKQQEIAQLIEESFSLKKQSEYLLEVAKKAVEMAIEESEEMAIKFINNMI